MRKKHTDVAVHAAADATTLYTLLRAGESWPNWSPIDSFQLERAGADEPEGIGAIRIFCRGRVIGRDQITELVPDRRFGYRHLSGLPVRDYCAQVDLKRTEDGTWIRWRTSFLPKVPGTGWLWRWTIRRFTGQCARGLADYASSSHSDEQSALAPPDS